MHRQLINQPTAKAVMATGTIQKVMNDSGNGYCKMPDGTLICWGTFSASGNTRAWGAMYSIDAAVDISFPVAFIADPCVTISCPVDKSFCLINTIHNATKITRVSWMRQTSESGTVTLNPLQYIAIGRWK